MRRRFSNRTKDKRKKKDFINQIYHYIFSLNATVAVKRDVGLAVKLGALGALALRGTKKQLCYRDPNDLRCSSEP